MKTLLLAAAEQIRILERDLELHRARQDAFSLVSRLLNADAHPSNGCANFGISLAATLEAAAAEADKPPTPPPPIPVPLPVWDCHKQVEALKIVEILEMDGKLFFRGDDGTLIPTDVDWLRKHDVDHVAEGEALGYYVRYKDGYTSWSPVKAFEEGYHRAADLDQLSAVPNPPLGMTQEEFDAADGPKPQPETEKVSDW